MKPKLFKELVHSVKEAKAIQHGQGIREGF